MREAHPAPSRPNVSINPRLPRNFQHQLCPVASPPGACYSSSVADLRIRPLAAGDEAHWRRLWTLYLEFYETSVPETVYQTTFGRLLSGEPNEYRGLIALRGQRPVGIAHYLFHRHCWKVENVCYLQDLYVDAAERGTGVGRALIEGVYATADAEGCPWVYWLTQHFNAVGRRLYDRIGELTPFIKYNRPLT